MHHCQQLLKPAVQSVLGYSDGLRLRSHKIQTRLDVGLEILDCHCQQPLLFFRQGTKVQRLLSTIWAQLHLDSKVIDPKLGGDLLATRHAGQVDVCLFRDGRARPRRQEGLDESEPRVGHAGCCAAGALLALDDLVATKLDP